MSHLTFFKDTVGGGHRCRRDMHAKSVIYRDPQASNGILPSSFGSPMNNASIQTSLIV